MDDDVAVEAEPEKEQIKAPVIIAPVTNTVTILSDPVAGKDNNVSDGEDQLQLRWSDSSDNNADVDCDVDSDEPQVNIDNHGFPKSSDSPN